MPEDTVPVTKMRGKIVKRADHKSGRAQRNGCRAEKPARIHQYDVKRRTAHFSHVRCTSEFERNLICERTQTGLTAARARGRKGGRRKVVDRSKRAHVVELYHSRKHTMPEICNLMGISRPTFYAYVDEFVNAK